VAPTGAGANGYSPFDRSSRLMYGYGIQPETQATFGGSLLETNLKLLNRPAQEPAAGGCGCDRIWRCSRKTQASNWESSTPVRPTRCRWWWGITESMNMAFERNVQRHNGRPQTTLEPAPTGPSAVDEQRPSFEFRNLHRFFGKLKAVNNVSFKAYPGQVMGF